MVYDYKNIGKIATFQSLDYANSLIIGGSYNGLCLFNLKDSALSIKSNVDTDVNNYLFPNPTSGTVRINFYLQKTEQTNLLITNQTGQQFAQLNLGLLPSGQQRYDYNASSLSSGIYFLTIKTATFSETFKLVKE